MIISIETINGALHIVEMIDGRLHGRGIQYGNDISRESSEIKAYIASHPEALVPEPVPEPPTQEQLDAQEMQQLLAYLASTDWYAIRYAETQVSIPDDVATERQSARDRISALRALG